MKRIVCASLFLLTSLFPCPAPATPREATVFPQSARVTEQTRVRLQPGGKDQWKAIFVIPGAADPASLATSLPPEAKFRLDDLTWRKAQRDEDAGVKDLRRQIRQIKEERNGLQGSLQGLENQIQFWQQQTKAKAKTTVEAGVIAAAIGKNIKKAVQDKLQVSAEIPRADKKIKELETELNQALGQNEPPFVWEVMILASASTGNPASDVLLTYSYTLTGCGWRPSYRFDTRPLQGAIIFGQDAEVWHNSGQPWNDIVVQLATYAAPASFLGPPALPAGAVKAREETKPKTKRTADKAKVTPKPADSNADGSAEGDDAPIVAAPDEVKLWSVGRKTIPSGANMNIKLSEEIWPAVFSYLVRPAQSPQAFISASFNLPASKKIPPGAALFFHQGALLGKANFSLAGKQGVLFFGQDPRVTVTRDLLVDQPKLRKWQLEARNDHAAPIKLRIEASTPPIQDAMTNVRLITGGADEKPGLLSWELELAGAEKKAFTYGMEFDAPANRGGDAGSPP